MRRTIFCLILATTTALCAQELQSDTVNTEINNGEEAGQSEEALEADAKEQQESAEQTDEPEKNYIETDVHAFYEHDAEYAAGEWYGEGQYGERFDKYPNVDVYGQADRCANEYVVGAKGCCEPTSSIEVRGAFVYFKPTVDQSAYVISSTNNRFGGEVYPNGRRHILCPNFKPGFRLAALYDFNRVNAVDLRFTYLDSRQNASTSGPFLFEAMGYPGNGAQTPEDTTFDGSSSIRQDIKFYLGDATLNRLTFDSDKDKLSFIFGLQYVYVKFHQKFASVGTTPIVNNLLNQKSNFWGIGPEVGVIYDYTLFGGSCGHLDLNVAARGAVLSSSLNSNLHYNTARTGPVGVNLTNDKLFRLNPTVDAKLGLSYALSFAGIDAALSFGYEFIWCSQCIDKITSYDVAFAGDTFDSLDSLSLQGPYVSLSIKF